MEAYEVSSEYPEVQAKRCCTLVCQEMRNNPAFSEIMSRVMKTICSNETDSPPADIKINVSDDKKELEISCFRKKDTLFCELMDDCISYKKATISLNPDGTIQLVMINNSAMSLEEYERRFLGLRVNEEKVPFRASEYAAVYNIYCTFNLVNRLGIEIACSEYKDFCPRTDNNYVDFIEESNNHCPKKWKSDDYPSAIQDGYQEYTPVREYWTRSFDRFGIVCNHRRGYNHGLEYEEISKYTCDIDLPNEICPSILISKTIDGVEKVKPENYFDCPGLDADTLEYRLNAQFIRDVENISRADYTLRRNAAKSAKYGLSHGTDLSEEIGQSRGSSGNILQILR